MDSYETQEQNDQPSEKTTYLTTYYELQNYLHPLLHYLAWRTSISMGMNGGFENVDIILAFIGIVWWSRGYILSVCVGPRYETVDVS